MNVRALSVAQLNLYVKSLLESDSNLRHVTVRGEISNYRRNSMSGHVYFTLKDESSAVRVVMFSSCANRLDFIPKDGMTVLVRGRVTLYETAGEYQINADSMARDGVGMAYLAFVQLKEKLDAEGLFAPEHKKELPALPKEIGVITSATGAALQDIVSVATRRFPAVNLTVKPAGVQGDDCASSVIRALEFFLNTHPVDVVIIARGGGSYEDLSGFNDEALARAVYGAEIPVVSAVGHETDFTILDFVADYRAPTPSAAAEIVVPVWNDLVELTDSLFRVCKNEMTARLETEKERLIKFGYRLNLRQSVKRRETEFDAVCHRIRRAYSQTVTLKEHQLLSLGEKVRDLSPMATLIRGFSITYRDNRAVTSVKDVRTDDPLKIRVKDGEITCVAKEIHEI